MKKLNNQRGFVWLIVLVVIGVLVLLLLTSLGKQRQEREGTGNGTKPAKEDIAVNIRTIEAEKKNDPYSVNLIIENKNSFNWGDCELKLNGDFKKKMTIIEVGDNRVPIIDFTKKDGTFFDIRKYTYNSFEVQCQKPYFDVQRYSY